MDNEKFLVEIEMTEAELAELKRDIEVIDVALDPDSWMLFKIAERVSQAGEMR